MSCLLYKARVIEIKTSLISCNFKNWPLRPFFELPNHYSFSSSDSRNVQIALRSPWPSLSVSSLSSLRIWLFLIKSQLNFCLIFLSSFRLTNPILDSLKKTNYTLPESTTVSVKSILCTLLDSEAAPDEQKLKHVTLALALLISSRTSIHESLTWIPERISASAESVLHAISKEFGAVLLNLLPELVPLLKERIKESSIDIDNESDQVTAASARAPVVLAILAAYQFRWFATQVRNRWKQLKNLSCVVKL